jgi:phosphohistidine phosphatase
MLWLLRHAEAADGSPDAARPLTERGVTQAQLAGHALARLGVRLELCLSSPKRRAMQTAELCCEALGAMAREAPELAGGPFDAEALAAGLESVMLVGHDPSISLALHDLTGVHARMRKGGLAGIEKRELVVLLRPAELAAIAQRQPVAG